MIKYLIYTIFGTGIFSIYSVIYTVCCGDCIRKKRNGNSAFSIFSRNHAVCDCMDCSIYGQNDRDAYRILTENRNGD